MQIPRSYIENYSKALNVVSEKARVALVDALAKIDYSQDVATIRNETIAIMQLACGASATMAARLAAEFYNGLRARFGIDDGFIAMVDSRREPEATEGAIRAFADKLDDSIPNVSAFQQLCTDRIDYETRKAANECVAYNAKRDPKKPKWARIPTGAETCDFCIMLASRGFVYHSEETASHAHANCVVADTEVAGIGLLAGMRRKYKGTLVNIRTRGGRNLTVTPNHPILTTRGWVVAGEIKELDNLICANFAHGDDGSVPDVNDIPPTAKEVFESCSFVNSALFDSVPVAAENLDGEIIGDSNIKIVNPLGFLKRAIETTINEPIEHCGFSVAQFDKSFSCPLFNTFRAFNLFGIRDDSTSDSIVSSGGLGGSLFGGHGRSANDSSFRLVADIGTSIGKPSDNSGTADVDTIGDGINALSVIERFENSIWHDEFLTACLDSVAFEYSVNGGMGDTSFGCDFLGSHARFIEIDNVEFVGLISGSCHVYNLSTKGGWYVSSGIITHNCDCRIVPSWDKSPLVQGYDPDKYYDMWKHPEKYENEIIGEQPRIELKSIDSSQYPDKFSNTKGKRQNFEAFTDALNKIEDADPKMREIYSRMGEIANSHNMPVENFDVKYAAGRGSVSYYSSRATGEVTKLTVNVPKMTNENIKGTISTTCHEFGHFIDLMKGDSADRWLSSKYDSFIVTDYLSLPPNERRAAVAARAEQVKPKGKILEIMRGAEGRYQAAVENVQAWYKAEYERIDAEYQSIKDKTIEDRKQNLKQYKALRREYDKRMDIECRTAMYGVDKLEDIYDALNDGYLRGKTIDGVKIRYGHGDSYYRTRSKQVEEIWANYCALSLTRPDLIELLRKDQPQLIASMDAMRDDILGALNG